MNQQSFAAAPTQRLRVPYVSNKPHPRVDCIQLTVSTGSRAGRRFVPNAAVRWQACCASTAGGGEWGSGMAQLRYGMPSLLLRMRSYRQLPGPACRITGRAGPGEGAAPVDAWLPTPLLGFDPAGLQQALSALRQDHGRRLPQAYRRAFCQSVAAGVPLRAAVDLSYLGILEPHASRPHVLRHRFALTGSAVATLTLPTDARLYLMARDDTEEDASVVCHAPAGACFGRAMSKLPPRRWSKATWQEQWQTLPQVCGGFASLDLLLQLWLWMQIVRVPEQPELAFLPASLLSLCRPMVPTDLWWDFGRPTNSPGGHLRVVTMHLPRRPQLRLGIGCIDLTIDRPSLPISQHRRRRHPARPHSLSAA